MSFNALPNAVLFALAGLCVFAVAVLVLLRILPGNLWTQTVEDNNIAAAILLASLVLSLGWIVAAAVH